MQKLTQSVLTRLHNQYIAILVIVVLNASVAGGGEVSIQTRELIEQLQDSNGAYTVANRINSLSESDKQAILPHLRKAMDDKDPDQRVWATGGVLAVTDDSTARKRMDAYLRDRATGTRVRAAESIGLLGNQAAPFLPALANLLRDKNKEVRYWAANSLQKLGPIARPARVALIRCLHEEKKAEIRGMALQALVSLDQPKAIIPAVKWTAVHDTNSEMKGAALQTLGQMKTGKKLLVAELGARNSSIRHGVNCGIIAYGEEAHRLMPKLMRAVRQGNPKVQRHTIFILQGLGRHAKDALPALREAMASSNQQIAGEAKYAVEAIEADIRAAKK